MVGGLVERFHCAWCLRKGVVARRCSSSSRRGLEVLEHVLDLILGCAGNFRGFIGTGASFLSLFGCVQLRRWWRHDAIALRRLARL